MPERLKNNRTFSTSDSPEQQIRQYLPVAMNMCNLRRCLSADYPWDNNAGVLKQVKKEYCDAFNNRKAGECAAQVIVEAITSAA